MPSSTQVRFGTHSAADGAEWSYHLTFVQVPAGVAWRAIVRDEAGALKGVPRGLVRGLTLDSPEIDQRLRDEVARAIEP